MYKNNLLLLSAIFFLLVPHTASAKDWFVPDSLATLGEAFEKLDDGDRILLGPGEHMIDPVAVGGKGFSLIGTEGRDATVITSALDEPFLTARGGGNLIHIEGVRFDKTDKKAVFSVIIVRAEVEFLDCDFVAGAGLQVDSSDGTIRGNRFLGCFDAVKVINSPLLIEQNLFDQTQQYGIVSRASNAEIYNNKFTRAGSASILIVGKRRYPVIGGSAGKGNIFLRHHWYVIVNDSRNEINARYNYWGIGPTSVMNQVGYPTNIEIISDKWDGDDRVRGMVNYSDWLEALPETGVVAEVSRSGGGNIPVVLIAAAAAVLMLALFIAIRMKRRSF